MNVLYERILRIVNWDMGTFPLLEVWKMKRGSFTGSWRPLMGAVVVGALALGVSALAAPRAAGDSVSDRKSTRLNSSHIQKSRMPSSA